MMVTAEEVKREEMRIPHEKRGGKRRGRGSRETDEK